ncbi:MAG: hypothetical protein NZ455_05710 [Bacteroidia bacterium]|nr:hypothetical protein [Bacteroidia bacterium]MDW8346180.1 hypothetical protein [Bacteroidia bacterium]
MFSFERGKQPCIDKISRLKLIGVQVSNVDVFWACPCLRFAALMPTRKRPKILSYH